MDTKDFVQFFRASQGADPFPWQAKLADHVLEGKGWPEVIALPTGAGKTAVLDLAVFALAFMADGGPPAPRRILYVVDRRLIVDAVYERALRIARLLEEAMEAGRETVVARAAKALVALGGPGTERPLEVARLRGGGFLERHWTRSPTQPTVVVSTVDQVGSRLLFRGYGLPRGYTNELAVHAGLAGCDALIFIDEAHLSNAFLQTIRAVGEYRRWQDVSLGNPWAVVALTATPRENQSVFPAPGELVRDEANPHLGRRLAARKLATLEAVSDEAELPVAMAQAAERLLAEPTVRVVAVIANRVLRARQVFEHLRARGHTAILLTGRIRPLDRERILSRWLERFRAGRVRDQETAPLIVVATQTIEVGADLDFDALVTEAAALDALRQRLGRLDRFGERGESRAVIIASREQVARGADDPVYGSGLRETWRFLLHAEEAQKARAPRRRNSNGLDLGWRSLEALLDGEDLARLCSPAKEPPFLLPVHIDLLAQTSPLPDPDPEVSALLHGPDGAPADVRVVWRADLDPGRPELWAATVSLCPPRAEEVLDLPAWTLRSWLAGDAADAPDVEGSREEADAVSEGRRCLRWAGPEEAAVVDPKQIRPGDTVVVPAVYGGCDEYGWHPASRAAVPDLAEEAAGQNLLRLHEGPLRGWLAGEALELALESLGLLKTGWEAGDDASVHSEVQRLLGLLEAHAATPATSGTAATLRERYRRLFPYPDGSGLIVLGPLESTSSDRSERSHSVGRRVQLQDHALGVERLARAFASTAGLSEPLINDLALAGRLHDLGKADPRFQAWLYGGDAEAASGGPLLAKSGIDPRDRAGWRLARRQAGYPAGGRHEALSVALATGADVLAQAHDRDLVLHLIGSHHGAGRPFFPPVDDPAAPLVELEWDGYRLRASAAHGLERLEHGVAERFWRLVGRYGWWGLAYLEAILRLADWRQSEQEQVGTSLLRDTALEGASA